MQPLWSFFLTISFSVLISGHAMAESTLRIDSETLNKQLLNKNVTIVDARSPETYQFGHIPGAVNFPEIETYEQRGVNGRIMVPSRMQELARSLGLKTDNTIIVYDDGEMTTAARVFWTLEVYGFKNVKVLDQGFGGWQAQARPTTLPPPKSSKVTMFP